jgi:DNA/RNA-binding domain of Phe-tRNA-synthetase-like protein
VAYFRYSTEIINRFPTIWGGVIYATGLTNPSTPPGLLEEFGSEQETVRQRLGVTPPSEIASLAAWRSTFSGFGVKPTQYRNAAEALLRRLSKQGTVPSINTLVDIASLVSLRYQLPVAVFDQHAVAGTTTVRFASGDERFTDLGSDSMSNPEPGEVVFVDDDGVVSARRWCWRQSTQSAAGSSTTDVLMTVEGHHSDAEADITRATHDLVGFLSQYQPQANLTSAILSPDSPKFPSGDVAP